MSIIERRRRLIIAKRLIDQAYSLPDDAEAAFIDLLEQAEAWLRAARVPATRAGESERSQTSE